MNSHLKSRPKKKSFPQDIQNTLKDTAIANLKLKLLPDKDIIKILLIGSCVNGSFGEYEPPGFRGSLYSDFDFIVFVEDDYKIPPWLKREAMGKPFPDDCMNLAYRNKRFIDRKYDIEVFFIRKSNMQDSQIQRTGELAGIPMKSHSKHKHVIVYCRSSTK